MNGDRLRSMPLPCRLGWHRVDPLAQWNNGYYFATCERCGRDLVRTAFDGWRVPSGYRVVWQAEPPAQRRAGLVTMSDSVREPEYASDRPFEFPFTHAPSAEARPHGDAQLAFAEAPVCETEPDADPFTNGELPADVDDSPAFATQEASRPSVKSEATAFPHRTAASPPISDWWDEPIRVATPFDAEIAARASIARKPDIAGPDIARPDIVGQAAYEPVARERDIMAALTAEPGEAHSSSPPPGASASMAASVSNAGRSEPRYPVIPDFMDDGAAATAWDGSPIPAAADTMPKRSVSKSARRNWHVMQAKLQRRVRALRVPARRVADTMSEYRERQDRQARASGTGLGRIGSSGTPGLFARQAAVTFVALAAGVALVAAVVDRRAGGLAASSTVGRASVPPTTPFVPSPTRSFSTGSTPVTSETVPAQGFVTASLLNCRETPTDNGNPVRKLARGAPVRILGTEPSWLSISHRGRQCWASSRFISTARPL